MPKMSEFPSEQGELLEPLRWHKALKSKLELQVDTIEFWMSVPYTNPDTGFMYQIFGVNPGHKFQIFERGLYALTNIRSETFSTEQAYAVALPLMSQLARILGSLDSRIKADLPQNLQKESDEKIFIDLENTFNLVPFAIYEGAGTVLKINPTTIDKFQEIMATGKSPIRVDFPPNENP